MTKNEQTNPYAPEHGYVNVNDMPVNGYGITLDTIRYILFELHTDENKLTDQPQKLLEYFNVDDISDLYNTDIDAYLADNGAPDINYVTGSNVDFEGFMSYDQSPISGLEPNEYVITKEKVQQEILNAVYACYAIPKNDGIIYGTIRKYIEDYTDYISFNDFD